MSEFEKRLNFDREFWDKGFFPLVGVDEAGRGALFGPVVAAAVILYPQKGLPNFCDSKKLSEKKREELFNEFLERGHKYSIGVVDAEEIDKINILNATMKAMKMAVEGLNERPSLVLIDGNQKPDLEYNIKLVVNGDELSLSIAAASIVAKVVRDRMIKEISLKYPEYELNRNKGYGTKKHIEAIVRNGLSPLHRRSFKPSFMGYGKRLWH